MDFSRTVHTITLPSLTTHSQIPIPWHLKAAGSRHESYFQLYWSCKKHWGKVRAVRSFIGTILEQSFLFHHLQTHCAQHGIKMTITHATWLSEFNSLFSHIALFFIFLLLCSSSLYPCISFLPLPSSSLHSCTSTPHSPFLGRIVAWWIVTSSNTTAICSIAMPRDRARVRQASTRYPVAGYRTLPSMQWPTK